MTFVTSTTEYLQLQKHYDKMKPLSLRRLFEEDTNRTNQFSQQVNGLYLDYSKNHINSETIELLCQFASSRQLPKAVQALVNGEYVNHTEHRQALHTALRHQGTATSEEQKLVAKTQEKMSTFINKIHSNQCLGFSGKVIDTVINIGIGGSDLGPRMAVQALDAFKKNIEVKFVANVDGCDLSDTLKSSDPETTLFIIASKTFTTLETLQNANNAREWILTKGCKISQLQQHFVAISTNISAAKSFGVANENIFPLWDWVGGRYSAWRTFSNY